MHVCCRIWLERVRSLHELTSQRLSVVLTDLDAIWTKNPLPYLLKAAAGQQQGFDLIVSKGHFPSEVYKNFRVAGACRWMFRRADSWAFWTGPQHLCSSPCKKCSNLAWAAAAAKSSSLHIRQTAMLLCTCCSLHGFYVFECHPASTVLRPLAAA